MTTIELQELLRYRFRYDLLTGEFFWRNAKHKSKNGKKITTKNYKGYIILPLNYKRILGHVAAWVYVLGEFPKNQIDHKNRIKDDNAWINLRNATNKQNHQNKDSVGVDFLSKNKKWRARINVDGREINLGCFRIKKQAENAYTEAKRKYHPFWEE